MTVAMYCELDDGFYFADFIVIYVLSFENVII